MRGRIISWSRGMVWSNRLIGWLRGMVRSRMRSMIFWFTNFTTVADISNITTIFIDCISHSLDSTIWKSHMVFTISNTITITMLIGTKMKTSIIILNSIAIFVIYGRLVFIFGFGVVVGCRFSRWVIRGRRSMNDRLVSWFNRLI